MVFRHRSRRGGRDQREIEIYDDAHNAFMARRRHTWKRECFVASHGSCHDWLLQLQEFLKKEQILCQPTQLETISRRGSSKSASNTTSWYQVTTISFCSINSYGTSMCSKSAVAMSSMQRMLLKAMPG